MPSTSFDTLTAARELEAAGIERRHAEAHANVLRAAVMADRDELATKADIRSLRLENRICLGLVLLVLAKQFGIVDAIAG